VAARGTVILGGVAAAALLVLDGVAVAAPEELLVGVLSEQLSRKCLASGEESWVDPHEEVGFVRLVPGKSLGPTIARRGLRGKIVIVRGRPRPDLRAPAVKHEGRCPEAQMRSDMVPARDGMRLRRGDGPALAGFEARRVEAFGGLAVALERGELRARFRNTLGRELTDLTLTMHYEGCYGKPGATSETRRFARVRVGEEVSGTFATLASTSRQAGMKRTAGTFRAHHVASSLEVRARTAGVHFDLDWKLTASTAPRCPSR
jgi:hypothetical protein